MYVTVINRIRLVEDTQVVASLDRFRLSMLRQSSAKIVASYLARSRDYRVGIIVGSIHSAVLTLPSNRLRWWDKATERLRIWIKFMTVRGEEAGHAGAGRI